MGSGMKDVFNVLIVDEDHELCRALSDTISDAGYRVECLSGSENPVPAIRELAPDAIILDVSMPEARGLETLRRLETHRHSRKMPVIVTSRQAELEYELLDAFDFLPKPVDEQRLLEDLALLVACARTGGPTPYPPLTGTELNLFEDFLVTHSGLHFDQRNSKILERGLNRRMRAVHAVTYRDYFAYLEKYQESRQELKKLLGLLTIGETYFFRYLPHYEALIQSVIPEFIERNRQKRSLRIWSAGCSSGEEPYSIAMVLLEHFPELADWDVRILATDINKRAIRQAREGVYRPRALRVTESRYAERYFRPLGGAFVIDRRVGDMVDFSYLNLQTGVFPSVLNGTAEVDILMCRNVMIYFRLPTIKRIVEKFSQCLRPGGYLFLGHAETLANISERFQRLHNAGGFYYRLRGGGESPKESPEPKSGTVSMVPALARVVQPSPPPPPPARRKPAPPPPSGPDPEEMYRRAIQAFNREEFKAASRDYDEVLRHESRHVGALVGKGFILANQGEYDGAVEFCNRALAEDDLCPEAYFLRGLILEMSEDWKGAVEEYRKALLLDLNFIMPHYNLSKIFWRQGRSRDARRELNNTRHLLETAAEEDVIPHSGGLTRAVFLEVCLEDTSKLEEA
jgi:chemotaxis protein methyltransferase CheR